MTAQHLTKRRYVGFSFNLSPVCSSNEKLLTVLLIVTGTLFQSVTQSTTLVQTITSQQLLDEVKFWTDIPGSQKMNPTDFGNP